MKPKKLDAAKILGQLTEIRRLIPFLDEKPMRPTFDGRLQARTAEEFEYLAVAEGLESLASEFSSAVERKYAEAMERALQVYYTAEELSRDPAHADLIPHVQRMREAYERDFGRPIPPRGTQGL
jgi:hypothetical protein